MEVIAAGFAWAFEAPSVQKLLTRVGLVYLAANSTIPWEDLSNRLSQNASMIFREQSAFAESTSRWREWHAPEVNVVVRTQTEGDVQETVSNREKHDFGA